MNTYQNILRPVNKETGVGVGQSLLGWRWRKRANSAPAATCGPLLWNDAVVKDSSSYPMSQRHGLDHAPFIGVEHNSKTMTPLNHRLHLMFGTLMYQAGLSVSDMVPPTTTAPWPCSTKAFELLPPWMKLFRHHVHT